MQTFYRVGRVNDPSDFVGISEKRDDLFPDSAPALGDCRDLLSPRPLLKVLQPLGRQLGCLGGVDLFEFSGYRFSLFPFAERQRGLFSLEESVGISSWCA